MGVKFFLLVPVFLLKLTSVHASTEDLFTKKQLVIIYDKCYLQIVQYESNLNKLGEEITDVEKTNANLETLIGMFVNRNTLVYNDLDPDFLLSEFYEIETYASNLSLWYPDGIKINIDYGHARSGKIIEHGQGIYSLDIMVNKTIDGNYLNRKQNTLSEDLLFRVVFFVEDDKIGETKIAGVRNAGSNNISFDQSDLADVKSVDLTEDEVVKLKQLSKTVIGDYVNYLNLLANPDELEDDKVFYKEAISNIIEKGENNIFNDLEEKPEDQYLDMATYLSEFIALYPDGINNLSLNTDSAEFKNVIRVNEGNYYVYIVLDKFFSGKLKGKKLYRFQDKLIFKVDFEKNNGAFANFKIEKIDNAGLNEAMMNSKSVEQDIASFTSISEREREGIYFNFNMSAGQGGMVDHNIKNMGLEENFHEWKVETSLNFGFNITASYMINNNLGVESGIGYNHMETSYSISSSENETNTVLGNRKVFYDNTTYSVQGSGDATYYKFIDIPRYDSLVHLNFLNIPVHGNFILGKPGKISLNIKTGFDFSFLFNSYYDVKGEEEYYIFVIDPQKQLPIDGEIHFNDPAVSLDPSVFNSFGLFNKTSFADQKTEFNNISKVDIRFVAHIGAEIPLGYFLYLTPGFTFNTTLGDLAKEKGDYYDIFGETDSNKEVVKPFHRLNRRPIKTTRLLFELGVKYKF